VCKERLNVVMVSSECAPWSKTGGLGDVAGSLPKALARRGHRTMCISPRYRNYAEGWETGVRLRLRVCGAEVEIGLFHGFLDGRTQGGNRRQCADSQRHCDGTRPQPSPTPTRVTPRHLPHPRIGQRQNPIHSGTIQLFPFEDQEMYGYSVGLEH
jgi:hypothetical protein